MNPKNLFQIDGFGAILSGLLYIFVLANFKSVFGMPSRILYFLAVLAGTYAAFSFSCYLMNLERWRPYMKIIATANLLHCCITIGLVIIYFQKITALGLLYFAGEIVVVVSIALFELKVARRK